MNNIIYPAKNTKNINEKKRYKNGLQTNSCVFLFKNNKTIPMIQQNNSIHGI